MTDPLTEAARLRTLGVEATANGSPEDGARLLQQALEQLDDRDDAAAGSLRVKVLIALAMCDFERHGLAACQTALATSMEAAEALPSPASEELVALCHSQRANALGRSGLIDEALAELDHAIGHLEALAPRDRWVVLLNRGMARGERGELDRAAADLSAAAVVAADAGLAVEGFIAAHDLGWLSYLAGDLPDAIARLEAAALAAPDVVDGTALLDRGRVLLEAGLLDDAVPMLERAVDACAENHQGHSVVEATYELARAELLRGEHTRALTLAEHAELLARDRGASGWQARAALVRLRLWLRLPDQGDRASEVAEEAMDIAARDDVDAVVRHRSGLVGAEALCRTHDAGAAREVLDRADDALGVPAAPHLSTRLERSRVAALIAATEGRSAEVDQVLRSAAAELRAGATTSSLDLQTARAVHASPLIEMDLARAVPAGPEPLLGAAERWRLAIARRGRTRAHQSTEVASRLADVRRLSERVRSGADEATLTELVEAERRAAAAARSATPAGTDGPGSPAADGDLDLAELLAALAEDGCDLLTTVEHRGVLWAVGVVDGVPCQRAVGDASTLAATSRRVRTDLAMLGRHGRGPMAEVLGASLDHGVGELRHALVQGLCPRSRRLVAVPGRAVEGLPWGLVAEGVPVTVAPSASWWLRSRSTGRAPRPPRVAALAGPRLEEAVVEAAVVRDRWGLPANGALSTVADLARALREDDLVHVAAHGRHHPQNPMFSAVSLADGQAFLYDLESTEIRADHVVLAACEVGRSTVRVGDVPVGLAAGLLALGARSVLAAISAVPDEVALPVMTDYHARLVTGTPSDVAIADCLAAAPRTAGAFVHYGTPWTSPAPADDRGGNDG